MYLKDIIRGGEVMKQNEEKETDRILIRIIMAVYILP